jgi:hypothetical protein
VGRRLPIPGGRYRVEIRADDLSGSASLPRLELSADEPRAPWRPVGLSRAGPCLAADVELPQGPRAWSLRLRGGGPILVHGIRLVVQPRRVGPV